MRNAILIFLLFLPGFLPGQNALYVKVDPGLVDSLRRVYAQTKNDTLRLALSRDLFNHYAEINDDSAFFYSSAMLKIAMANKFRLWEAAAYYSLGYTYQSRQNYTDAFRSYTKARSIAENIEAEKGIPYIRYFALNSDPHFARYVILGNVLDDFAGLYFAVGDTARYHEFEKKAIEAAESVGDKTTLSLIYMHLANKSSGTDSSYRLAEKSLRYAEEGKQFMYRSLTYNLMGWHWMNKGEFDSAAYFFHNGLENDIRQNTLTLASGSYRNLAVLHLRKKEYDSALYFIKKSLAITLITKDIISQSNAYVVLSNIFIRIPNTDSALHYLRLSSALKDSIFNIRIGNLTKYRAAALKDHIRLRDLEQDRVESRNRIKVYSLLTGLVLMLAAGVLLHRNNRQKQKVNRSLEKALMELNKTQSQLVHAEKMASLGELTAGIAHEIQNPLNFVNNFSEVSNELINEIKEERQKTKDERDEALVDELLSDISLNLEKITNHGKRADGIIKGMLQHSRSSSGQKEPTDINALCDEYLRLSYHGLRAKDKLFNATIETDFDESIGKIDVLPQDIGRVILNLLTNAFYAVNERNKAAGTDYEPTVMIGTKKLPTTGVEIQVRDNGDGIPPASIDKIFQPFFTTKPAGQGTGLGLSMSYDIVTKGHHGTIRADSISGGGTVFTINLPQ